MRKADPWRIEVSRKPWVIHVEARLHGSTLNRETLYSSPIVVFLGKTMSARRLPEVGDKVCLDGEHFEGKVTHRSFPLGSQADVKIIVCSPEFLELGSCEGTINYLIMKEGWEAEHIYHLHGKYDELPPIIRTEELDVVTNRLSEREMFEQIAWINNQ
jgi:hypothetical protein